MSSAATTPPPPSPCIISVDLVSVHIQVQVQEEWKGNKDVVDVVGDFFRSRRLSFAVDEMFHESSERGFVATQQQRDFRRRRRRRKIESQFSAAFVSSIDAETSFSRSGIYSQDWVFFLEIAPLNVFMGVLIRSLTV